MKEEGVTRRVRPDRYGDLHLPRNTPIGFFLAFFAVVAGFALIWRIDWLAVAGLIGAVAVALRESWRTDREIVVPSREVAAFEQAHGMPAYHCATALDVKGQGELNHQSAGVSVQQGANS
jgi:cytochrome o ubiquinol oxidase subunit 1